MKPVKVHNLKSPAIEWVLCQLEGCQIARQPHSVHKDGFQIWPFSKPGEETCGAAGLLTNRAWSPSMPDYLTGKAGDDIIDREKIGVECGYGLHREHWRASAYVNYLYSSAQRHTMDASTRRLAAMRCYIASKHGDTVEVPEELL
jgi:hypothetical protein